MGNFWKNLVPNWAKNNSSAVTAEEVVQPKRTPIKPPVPSTPPQSTALTLGNTVEQEVLKEHKEFMRKSERTFQRASKALTVRPQIAEVASPLPGVMIGRREYENGSAEFTCIYNPRLVVHHSVGLKPMEEQMSLRRIDGVEDIESFLSMFAPRVGRPFTAKIPLQWERIGV